MLLKFLFDKTPLVLPILFVTFVIGIIGFSFTVYASDTVFLIG